MSQLSESTPEKHVPHQLSRRELLKGVGRGLIAVTAGVGYGSIGKTIVENLEPRQEKLRREIEQMAANTLGAAREVMSRGGPWYSDHQSVSNYDMSKISLNPDDQLAPRWEISFGKASQQVIFSMSRGTKSPTSGGVSINQLMVAVAAPDNSAMAMKIAGGESPTWEDAWADFGRLKPADLQQLYAFKDMQYIAPGAQTAGVPSGTVIMLERDIITGGWNGDFNPNGTVSGELQPVEGDTEKRIVASVHDITRAIAA